ncbi:MAG: GxxExxY protein [Brevundimonas sp.]|nr:MAG: GxxExxY protein [Brevundimonas sp.]
MHEGHEGIARLPVEVERVGRAVLDAAFRVHSTLGPGLLESVYETCLAEELKRMGLRVERQVGVPVAYGDARVDVGFRLDLLVERVVIVEIKSIDALASIHATQLLTYLRFSGVRLGYLINFNSTHLKTGIRRIIL